MYLSKAMLLLLAIIVTITGSEGLRCYQCEYAEGDADESCLTGNPGHSVEVPDPPSDGMQFICKVELKIQSGIIFVNRSYIEIEGGLDPEIRVEGPIALTTYPELDYIRFRGCNSSDDCNAMAYIDPPPFPPGPDLKCYICSNCPTPTNLMNVPRHINERMARSKPHVTVSSSNTRSQYTSEPIGEFGWEAYCQTGWYYNEEEKRQLYDRVWSHFHKDLSGNMDGSCIRSGRSEHCFCKGDGCNNDTQLGLDCFHCQDYGGSKGCEKNPQDLKFNPDEWAPNGTKYVCTLEAMHVGGELQVTRGSQLVNEADEPIQCIAGPIEGQDKNPELDYVTMCSCDTDGCNNIVTFDPPPKLPSPIKCYECQMSLNSGCDAPDPKFLKDAPAIPSTLIPSGVPVGGRNSTGLIYELMPSEPIGEFKYVAYCSTLYSDILQGITSREHAYFYEPEPDKEGMDGKCVRDERQPGWTYCYCKGNACNNKTASGVLGLAFTGSLLAVGIVFSRCSLII